MESGRHTQIIHNVRRRKRKVVGAHRDENDGTEREDDQERKKDVHVHESTLVSRVRVAQMFV
eukprot:2089807-Pyramimonas_sp.AAC.1